MSCCSSVAKLTHRVDTAGVAQVLAKGQLDNSDGRLPKDLEVRPGSRPGKAHTLSLSTANINILMNTRHFFVGKLLNYSASFFHVVEFIFLPSYEVVWLQVS